MGRRRRRGRDVTGILLLDKPVEIGSTEALQVVKHLYDARKAGVARAAYDHVIVDTFPILDGIAIATFDRADQVWQVVAPTVPNVLGAERFNELLLGVGVEHERQRIVLNTSVPKHTGQLTPQDVATRLDRDLDVVIPFARAAVAACNTGVPVVLSAGRLHPFRRRVAELASLVSTPTAAMAEGEA